MTAPQPGAADAAVPTVDVDNPWPGLASYQESDQEFFQGRAAQIDELNQRVRRERLTVLFGVSGLGKTSLLRAGVFPKLRDRDELPVWIRLRFGPEGGDLRGQVLAAIAAEAGQSKVEAPPPVGSETMWEYFHHRDTDFWSARNRLVTPVLVLDQFEEVFSLGRDREGTDPFLEELADLVEGRPGRALKARIAHEPDEARRFDFGRHRYRVILSLREDFLPEIERLRESMPSCGQNRMRLQAMDGDAAFQVVNLTKGKLVSEEIAAQVVRVAAGRDAVDQRTPLAKLQVEPPILSLLCRELNNRRSAARQERITGELLAQSQGEILETFYERCMAQVSPELRAYVEDQLLTKDGFRDNRACVDALRQPGISEADLRKLVDARLLRLEERAGALRIELTHDVLTKVAKLSRDRRHERQRALEEKRKLEAELLATRRQAARRRAWVVGLLVILGALTAFGAVAAWQHHKAEIARAEAVEQRNAAEQQRAEAEKQRNVARAKEEETKRVLGNALFREAGHDFDEEKPAEAVTFLAASMLASADQDRARSRAASELLYRAWSPPIGARMQHDNAIEHATFSADGRRVLTASKDGTARLWDAQSGAPIGKPLQHDKAVHWATFSPDGTRVVTASGQAARVWDASSGEPVGKPMDTGGLIFMAAFSPDGARIITSATDKTARLWDAHTNEPVGQVMQHEGVVLSAVFDSSGGRLVTASLDGNVRVWDAHSGRPLGRPMGAGRAVYGASFSPDGRYIATVTSARQVRLWDSVSGKAVGSPIQHDDDVNAVVFSPDGKRIATASKDHTARLWDASGLGEVPPSFTAQPLGEKMIHQGPVRAAGFSPDGTVLVTASDDRTARLWDGESGAAISAPLLHDGAVSEVELSNDGKVVLTVSEDRTARLWRVAKPAATPLSMRHELAVRSAVFSPDGTLLITASEDGTARLLDTHSGEEIGRLKHGDGWVRAAVISSDGARVATGSDDGTARLWDAHTGAAIGSPMEHGSKVFAVAFGPDGERLATGTEDGQVRLWDGRSGALIKNLPGHSKAIFAIAFSRDGARLATASQDKTARIADTASGTAIGEPLPASDWITAVAFSPDGALVATASADGARLWNASSGAPVGKPLLAGSAVLSASFSPDGSRLVTAADDNTARLWDVHTGAPIGEPMQHPDVVTTAAFSPDGSRVVTASQEVARLWDAHTGEPVSEPLRHPKNCWVNAATFSPDGQRVATAGRDGTARIWDVPAIPKEDAPILATAAEWVSGRALDDSGVLTPVQNSDRLLQELRDWMARRPNDEMSRILSWFLDDSETRAISPCATAAHAEAPQK